MEQKKKHPSNRVPDAPLNDGVHFEESLKNKKERKEVESSSKKEKKDNSENGGIINKS
jgi:hypothetical protein